MKILTTEIIKVDGGYRVKTIIEGTRPEYSLRYVDVLAAYRHASMVLMNNTKLNKPRY